MKVDRQRLAARAGSPDSSSTDILWAPSQLGFSSATTAQNFKGDPGPAKLEGAAVIRELQPEGTPRELCGDHMVSPIGRCPPRDKWGFVVGREHWFSQQCKGKLLPKVGEKHVVFPERSQRPPCWAPSRSQAH